MWHSDFVNTFVSPINHHFCKLNSASLCNCGIHLMPWASPSWPCSELQSPALLEPGFGTCRIGDSRTNWQSLSKALQKGLDMGSFHNYEFNRASSLRFFSKVPCRHHLVVMVNRTCALGGR